jgi:hypothetical protein
MHRSSNRETDDSEESNQLDQPGTSKQSPPNNDHVFKKPFPVKQKAPRHKTAVKEVSRQKVKVRNGRCQDVKLLTAAGRKFPLSKYLHPSDLATRRRNVASITKLLSEKGLLQKKRKRQPGKTVDLFKTLHDIVLSICEQVSYTL